MAQGELFPIRYADEAAEELLEFLDDACARIRTAGSVRRNKPQVHDLDIVIYPKMKIIETGQLDLFGAPNLVAVPHLLFGKLDAVGWGKFPQNPYPRVIRIHSTDGIPAELYLTEPDGSNFDALLQMRTGSEKFNISLAERAKNMNMHYKAGYGIFSRYGNRLDDGTEEGIFKVLGLPFIPPMEREGTWQEAVFVRGNKHNVVIPDEFKVKK